MTQRLRITRINTMRTLIQFSIRRLLWADGRPSPPKIQGCQKDQQIQRWCKDQLQDSIANKGMAWPNYRQSSFPS